MTRGRKCLSSAPSSATAFGPKRLATTPICRLRRDVAGLLKRALGVLEQAGVSDDLARAAIPEVIRLLAAAPQLAGTEASTRQAPRAHDTARGRIQNIAARLGLEPTMAALIYQETEDGLELLVSPNRLD